MLIIYVFEWRGQLWLINSRGDMRPVRPMPDSTPPRPPDALLFAMHRRCNVEVA